MESWHLLIDFIHQGNFLISLVQGNFFRKPVAVLNLPLASLYSLIIVWPKK